MADWDPDLYHRFRNYRAEPVEMIFARLPLDRAKRIVDLGCGTGEHTVELARRAPASLVLGIDSSIAMIERTTILRDSLDDDLKSQVDFVLSDIRDFIPENEYDLIFSNAAFQWIGDHRALLARCFRALRPGGSLGVQMPANDREIAQVTIFELANEPGWSPLLDKVRTPSDRFVQSPEEYRAMLAAFGFIDIDCYYHVFRHPMCGPSEVVEWSRATVLRPFLDQLPVERRDEFIRDLTSRLELAYGTSGPLTFEFRRLFLFARRAEDQSEPESERP